MNSPTTVSYTHLACTINLNGAFAGEGNLTLVAANGNAGYASKFVLGSQGEVMGVTGNTAIHLREPGEKEPKSWEIYVDVGASSDKEVAELGLRVGHVGVYCDGPMLMLSLIHICTLSHQFFHLSAAITVPFSAASSFSGVRELP